MQSVERAPRRRVPRWWPRAAAALAILVAGAAGAWWLFWSVPVVSTGGFGVGFSDAEPGEPYSIGMGFLCLDGAGSAVIEDVTVDPAGLTVVDFAVRPRPEPPALALGTEQTHLADTGFGDVRSFSGQCDDGAYTELAVEVTAVAGPASTRDVDLHWRAGVRSGVLTVPISITLCSPDGPPELCEGIP